MEAKQKGFADRQIAHMLGCYESEVYAKRMELDINRVYKLVDTCAAEFNAQTPYYYSTFENKMITSNSSYADNESIVTDKKLEEVIITATKIPTKKKHLGKVVYQISKEVIARNQGRSVVDLLNEVPGIEINGSFSTKGQNLGYYMRGGRNRQVAILIDGVNVNDPSSFNGRTNKLFVS